VLVLLAIVAVATWPQILKLDAGVSDFGDPLLNAWALGWIAHTVPEAPLQLFDANIFHPERWTLAYSETLIVPGLLAAPVIWLSGNTILAYNVLLLAGYVLSGLATFLLVRSLTGHAGAALVAGTVFALAPYRMDHYAHLQMQMTWWLPLALWAVHSCATSLSTRSAVGLGLAMAGQLYSCVYIAVYGSVLVGVVALWVVVSATRESRPTALRRLLLAAVIAGLAAVPAAVAYREASRRVGDRSHEDVSAGSATLADYRRAHPESALYGDRRAAGVAERRLFPGYTAPALALAAVIPPISPVVLAYGVGAALAFDLSRGVNGFASEPLRRLVWPMRALRVPARFGMIVSLAVAVLAGLGAARLCRGRAPRTQLAFVILVMATAVAEGRMRPVELVELPDRAPPVYLWLAAQPRGVICEYPIGGLQGRIGPQDPTYMYYSTLHWQPLVNGFSGFEPASYRELLDRMRGFPDDVSVAYLRRRQVTYLLVHSGFYIRGDFRADVASLRQRSDVEWVGSFRWKTADVTEVFIIRQ
jgi:hypothetical protein